MFEMYFWNFENFKISDHQKKKLAQQQKDTSASEQATSNKTQTQQRAQRLTFVFDIIPNNLHQNGTE
jgi:hypothetical protein